MASSNHTSALQHAEAMRERYQAAVGGIEDDKVAETVLRFRNRFDDIIRKGAITSRTDAAVKLRSVLQMFEEGPRVDGSDESALRDVIAWLEAN